MTSGNWASQLVNECEVKRRKEWPTTDQKLKSKQIQSPWKTVAQTFIRTANTHFELLKPSIVSYVKFSMRSCVFVYVAISSTTEFKKMVSTRMIRQSNRRLLSHLDYINQGIIIGNNASERRESIRGNEVRIVGDFTVGTSGNNLVTNENTVNLKTLERCFNERIDREMSNIVDTVADRIQNAILTALDSIVAPKIALEIRSTNAFSGRNATSVTANSEHGEHVGITATFENASGNNIVIHISNANDETRNNIADEVSDLSSQKHILTGKHTLITPVI